MLRRGPPTPLVALFIVPSPLAGAHCGFVYAPDDSSARKVLHLAFHHDFRDGPSDNEQWIFPEIDDDEQRILANRVRLLAKRATEQKVPYSYTTTEVTIDDQGIIQANSPYGLTCATFVMLVWEKAGIPLLDNPSWTAGRSAARRAKDAEVFVKVVQELQKRDFDHAERVRQNPDCVRFRAEEVVAGSAWRQRPISFCDAELAGAMLLQTL